MATCQNTRSLQQNGFSVKRNLFGLNAPNAPPLSPDRWKCEVLLRDGPQISAENPAKLERTSTDYPRAGTVVTLFENIVRENQTRSLRSKEDTGLTYGELNRRANRLVIASASLA